MGKKVWFGWMVCVVIVLSSTMVMGWDTSPYLIGAWEDDGSTIYTDFIIMNPTPVTLDVYAAFFKKDGGFIEGKCFKKVLSSNAKWYLKGVDLGLSGFGTEGTAKFVAVAQGANTYDRDLMIGGFQNRWVFQLSSSQANLNAVVLNRNTIAEIKEILTLGCTLWQFD